jgi:K+-transporting ATPase ATPase C chain
MRRDLISALLLFLLLTLLTGLAYPLAVTGLAQLLFREPANGSLILRDGRPAGSALIGQPFSDPKYFWSRPSATSPQPYNGMASAGSNLGPTNPALVDAAKAGIDELRRADPGNDAPVPMDLITASSSGLDPHISVAAAEYQLRRVARARGLDEDRLRALLEAQAEPRWLGLVGEPRVNVLRLNLALDSAAR